MFLGRNDAVHMDLSTELRDSDDWKVGTLRTFEYPLNITSLAIEPISCLLGVGTADGMVYVFGGPGVETRLTLPEPVGVKFLQFSSSTFRLVCIDDNNLLHIWDLSNYGRPKHIVSARFDQTNSLTTSPSHSHAFIALSSGEIKTYDLICLRKSPYTIPNMWKLYEQKMLADGLPDMTSPESRVPVETIIHPRDLNLLFVAYGGGIILSDLTQRNTVQAFELVLPPGAPGGSGYGSHDVLAPRRPQVTALAIHPSGHFFAVGHADGCLAFWAVEDEDQPLLVRTLDTTDVNMVDTQKLDEHLFQEQPTSTDREPIFKISWSSYSQSSDPRGGNTTLTILGGLLFGEEMGLTVFQLPVFNPQEPPASDAPGTQAVLHPFFRTAMRNSLDPIRTYFYYTSKIVQDFLLVPRKTPHLSGTFDPIAILLLIESEGSTRVVEALQFPPPEFAMHQESNQKTETALSKNESNPIDSLSDDLASTLRALQTSDEPRRLRTPGTLLNGSTGLIGGQLLKLEREIYQSLSFDSAGDDLHLPLKGGAAWADEIKTTELKLSKYQPNRVLITHHVDLTVRFHDLSAQLLLGLRPTPIQHDFPNPLPYFTTDMKPTLMDPSVSKRTSQMFIERARIDSVYFTTESFELAVVFVTGELVVCRLSGPRETDLYREAADDEVILLQHVPRAPASSFFPYFMLAPGKGSVEACAISDVGFIAASYSDGSLFVIDMRIPKIILRYVPDRPSKGRATSLHFNHSDPPDVITTLTWTVSQLDKDPQLQLRLIGVCVSGLCQIYTITQTVGTATWICAGPISAQGIPRPFGQGIFVLDGKSGEKCTASRARLSASGHRANPNSPSNIFVTCGAKGARSFSDINGQRVGKVDWGTKMGNVQSIQVVGKLGSHVLVALTDRHEALVYSLPHLEYLHVLKLPPVQSTSISMDESGDFMAWTMHPLSETIHRAIYGTMFDIRRAYDLPDIDFLCTKPSVPPQPQPVSMGPASLLGSWFTFNQSLTGDQLDILLGGDDRPIPEPEQKPRQASGSDVSAGVSSIAAAAAATQSNLYSRLTSALNERGQLLGDLEDRFNALEEGSKSMVAQAKRLATQQTAKSWFGL